MRTTDKIGFEDIFDLKSIEKTFEQTLEADILKLMEKWENEKKTSRKETSTTEKDYIKSIVREVLKEEIKLMFKGYGLFGERFFKELELQGFSRNCIGCMYAEKNYAYSRNI